MKHGRHLIHCLLVLLVTSSAALAGNDLPAASASLPGSSSTSIGSDATTALPLQQSNHNPCDPGSKPGSCAPVTTTPVGCGHQAVAGLVALRELEGALLDDESLGRVSGGASFVTTPDAIGRNLLAIILWDEGKPRRSTTSSVPYEWGNAQISSTNSFQGR